MIRASIPLLLVAALGRGAIAAPAVDYLSEIQPILRQNCVKCHGPDDQNAELRLDTAAALLTGGNGGPAIAPGDSGKSLLIAAISGSGKALRMPPEEEAPKLSDEQIALLRRWVDEGAKHPADEQPLPRRSAVAGSKHWAFQPIVRREPPTVNAAAFVKTPIDAFILSQLERQSIVASEQADRETLIRRLSLDLTGLLPTLDEVTAFVGDSRDDAYDAVVDRLLASPHYGERWARWWLDQARYADSDGYSNDEPRTMWRYRDWVIEAFNRDLPFNDFAIEQLAGDLLPGATLAQRVATGFHRNTQTYSEGDSATEEYRVENVVDRVHTTGVVFMGLTLGCARCHDHKFDPLSQREFYRLFAIFNNQDEPKLEVPSSGWSVASDGPKPAMTSALVMAERSVDRATHIHVRGDYLALGAKVEPGVPAVLPAPKSPGGKLTRLELAQWLVADEHPLTSRVIVNRMWQVFFGTGIVETDDDFGTQGQPPSHPELLDWLSSEFQRVGWSTKALHRLIVTSAVYQQTSEMRPELLPIDPRNLLLARQNRLRLDAELVRDAALTASGLLSRKVGGPSVYPPQPEGVMRLTQHATRGWTASSGEDRYRRGMYTFLWRLAPHPFLMAFNAPEASTTCTRRPRANTPTQSLMLLNDEAFVEAAQALAVRVLREAPANPDESRLELCFRHCLGRQPSAAEKSVLLTLLAAERADPAGVEQQRRFPAASQLASDVPAEELSAWTSVARTLLNLDEFITRE